MLRRLLSAQRTATGKGSDGQRKFESYAYREKPLALRAECYCSLEQCVAPMAAVEKTSHVDVPLGLFLIPTGRARIIFGWRLGKRLLFSLDRNRF